MHTIDPRPRARIGSTARLPSKPENAAAQEDRAPVREGSKVSGSVSPMGWSCNEPDVKVE
jgi:hypothetical protein